MSPRRSAPGQGPTPGRSGSLLSRSGVMFPQRNLALEMGIIDGVGQLGKTTQEQQKPYTDLTEAKAIYSLDFTSFLCLEGEILLKISKLVQNTWR